MTILEKLAELEKEVQVKFEEVKKDGYWLDEKGEMHSNRLLANQLYENAKKKYNDFKDYILNSNKELTDEYNEGMHDGV